MDEKINSKIILSIDGDKASVEFTPEMKTPETTSIAYGNLMNNVPTMFLSVLSRLPLLRPVFPNEAALHTYVFREGEDGEKEQALLEYRKKCYKEVSAVFSQILSVAFPDVEYINACDAYKQDYVFDHSEQEVSEYHKDVEALAYDVRTNFDKYLKEVLTEEEK